VLQENMAGATTPLLPGAGAGRRYRREGLSDGNSAMRKDIIPEQNTPAYADICMQS